ncbi:MAG: hypothetical protein ABSD41_10985, partial [Candidatus Bathyarchaeia archaeon]
DARARTVECFDESAVVIYSELRLKLARSIFQESGHIRDKRNDHRQAYTSSSPATGTDPDTLHTISRMRDSGQLYETKRDYTKQWYIDQPDLYACYELACPVDLS